MQVQMGWGLSWSAARLRPLMHCQAVQCLTKTLLSHDTGADCAGTVLMPRQPLNDVFLPPENSDAMKHANNEIVKRSWFLGLGGGKGRLALLLPV